MLLIACDIINSFCQSLFLVWISNNAAEKKNKISINAARILVLLMFSDIVAITYAGHYIGITDAASGLIMEISVLLLLILFYRKSILNALLGFGIGFGLLVSISYILLLLYRNFLSPLNLAISIDLQMLLSIFAPVGLFYFVVYKYRKYIFNYLISLKNLKHSLIFILLFDFVLIFTSALRSDWLMEPMGMVLKSFLYIIALVVFIFSLFYFAKINDKSKEVEMLNAALSEKITELKKIKHDYGSEISSLYGLYQLGKIDRIGSLLKGIIDRNQSLDTTVNISIHATPMVASVLNSAVSAGINVIVFDSADYEELNISDNELIRILSNIIRNSIDALKQVNSPTIKFKSYNNYDGITVNIINNGPKIPASIMSKIFQAGFSTKANDREDRGYGLSIVEELINKCNGNILIESDDQETEFKINIPYKTSSRRKVSLNNSGGDVLEKIDSKNSLISG